MIFGGLFISVCRYFRVGGRVVGFFAVVGLGVLGVFCFGRWGFRYVEEVSRRFFDFFCSFEFLFY